MTLALSIGPLALEVRLIVGLVPALPMLEVIFV